MKIKLNTDPTRLLHPLLVLLVVCLPQALMLTLAVSDYHVIKHLLGDDSRRLLVLFGNWLGALVLLTTIVLLIYVVLRQALPNLLTPLFLLLFFGSWSFFFLYNMDKLELGSVPEWMFDSSNVLIYPATFVSPGLLLALLQLTHLFTPTQISRREKIWTFLLTLLIPAFIYLSSMATASFWRGQMGLFFNRLFPWLLIIATLVFFFLLLRSIWVLVRDAGLDLRDKPQIRILVYIWPLLLFPLAGLLFNNNGELIGLKEFTFVFGNFSHPAFYLLAALNGLILLLPEFKSPRISLMVWLAKWTGFSFNIYFLLVFLPWLPLSLIAIAAVGIGFLMLAPLFTFFFHAHSIWNDYQFLKERYFAWQLWPASMLCFLIVPGLLYADYRYERAVLHAALNYVYTPDFSERDSGQINQAALRSSLQRVRTFKERSATPYLDTIYRNVVLDNLTIADSKLDTLEQIFFGDRLPVSDDPRQFGLWGSNKNRNSSFLTGWQRPPQREGVRLKALRSRTEPAPDGEYSISVIELDVQNDLFGQREYYTSFRLPPGAFIRKHYLMMNGKKEYGILSEQKTALWVYRQITSRRRDPGLLYYRSPESIALHIFPVAQNETRTSGFELVHRRSLELQIDDKTVRLVAKKGHHMQGQPAGTHRIQTKNADLLLHWNLIVDCSIHTANLEQYADWLVRFQNQLQSQNQTSSVVCMSHRLHPLTEKKVRPALLQIQKHDQSGFFLGRALTSALTTSYKTRTATAAALPVFVVLTDRPDKAQWVDDVGRYNWITAGAAPLFVLQRKSDSLQLTSWPGRLGSSIDATAIQPVIVQPDVTLLAARSSTILAQFQQNFHNQARELLFKPDRTATAHADSYSRAVQNLWQYREHLMQPASDQLYFSALKGSFDSGYLNPLTASLALENEAQKAALKRKQDAVLNAHRGLDIGEDPPERMDEPGWLWLLALLALSGILLIRPIRRFWNFRP
ncbi:MAG: MSEP-CTERM sorting domain-containing protein [Leptospiraceae bacterium]|nr:MSEP-CTERM sorting domain-containing protein [Leptospiraceae bacterium]